ncbi:hypothetical protein LOAG_06937 [Loa loa]|uniref:Uncharacterized protein n=1 Tax=Loa loa TaxID=7209 RepID=A0A1S0TXN1_LOALO|nr:hypothetical protein LOAG_06937 [Loa loa]EFO21552.2 hypothetical protein LOAG_06937 [Loa loa]
MIGVRDKVKVFRRWKRTSWNGSVGWHSCALIGCEVVGLAFKMVLTLPEIDYPVQYIEHGGTLAFQTESCQHAGRWAPVQHTAFADKLMTTLPEIVHPIKHIGDGSTLDMLDLHGPMSMLVGHFDMVASDLLEACGSLSYRTKCLGGENLAVAVEKGDKFCGLCPPVHAVQSKDFPPSLPTSSSLWQVDPITRAHQIHRKNAMQKSTLSLFTTKIARSIVGWSSCPECHQPSEMADIVSQIHLDGNSDNKSEAARKLENYRVILRKLHKAYTDNMALERKELESAVEKLKLKKEIMS